MEETHKEMYAQLYQTMSFVQKMLKQLELGIDDTLNRTTDMHVNYLNKQMDGECQMEKILKRMFEENVFRDDV